MPPLEIWADGIEEYVYWKSGGYHVKSGAPDWVREKLEEYNNLLDVEPDENGMETLY